MILVYIYFKNQQFIRTCNCLLNSKLEQWEILTLSAPQSTPEKSAKVDYSHYFNQNQNAKIAWCCSNMQFGQLLLIRVKVSTVILHLEIHKISFGLRDLFSNTKFNTRSQILSKNLMNSLHLIVFIPVYRGTLMISSQQKEIIWVFDLVGQHQAYGFQRPLSTEMNDYMIKY